MQRPRRPGADYQVRQVRVGGAVEMLIGGVQNRLRRIPRLSWSAPARAPRPRGPGAFVFERTVTHQLRVDTSVSPACFHYLTSPVRSTANTIASGNPLRDSSEYGNQPRPIRTQGKKQRMDIRNVVAGSAVALAMVCTPITGVGLGVASADGCGSGTGAGGGVWCAPPNSPPLIPKQVLTPDHQNARGDLADVRCQWPGCGPRWWPVNSPRPMR